MLVKTPTGALAPADELTSEYLQSQAMGTVLKGEFKKQRNAKFHRKVFSLFKLAFDVWDAPALEYKGQAVEKNFDRFRKDMTILAGFYEPVVSIKGEVRVEAKSLSFSSMDDAEFEQVFKALLEAVWKRVLQSKGYGTPESVEQILEELLRYS